MRLVCCAVLCGAGPSCVVTVLLVIWDARWSAGGLAFFMGNCSQTCGRTCCDASCSNVAFTLAINGVVVRCAIVTKCEEHISTYKCQTSTLPVPMYCGRRRQNLDCRASWVPRVAQAADSTAAAQTIDVDTMERSGAPW